MDIDIITRSVAYAETGNGKKGYGADRNNICGIMYWPNGNRAPKSYGTYMDGFNDCSSLLTRKYSGHTIDSMAVVWTGNHNPDTWASNVKYWYNKQK